MRRRIVLLGLLLTACSAQPAGEPPAPKAVLPSPTSTPDAGRFDTAGEMMAALDCEGESKTDEIEDHHTLRDFGVCQVGEHNFDLYLVDYGSNAWDELTEVGMPSIEGPGWIVVAPTGEEAARYAHGKLGGTLNL